MLYTVHEKEHLILLVGCDFDIVSTAPGSTEAKLTSTSNLVADYPRILMV
jgi:hypothetical protein